MNRIVIAAAAAAFVFAGAANAQEDLAKNNGCLNCHGIDAKKGMGPTYKSVAAKYKGDAGAADKLTAEIKGAKGHPAVKVSEDDLKSIVKWILAM